MRFKAVKGTSDILPEESGRWQYVESVIRRQAEIFGFKEIRTPVFEETALFVKGTGDTTDIVQKEMYTFTDKGQRSITLRPEGTPPVIRSLLEHSLLKENPLAKVYYLAPMFRYERPQAGRLRQHTQFGAEIVGSPAPQADVEVIALLFFTLQKLGLAGLKLRLNTLGCPNCRPSYRESLMEYLQPKLTGLCEYCNDRFSRNPLRVLDCKIDQHKFDDAPEMGRFLCPECQEHFRAVQDNLKAINIPFILDKKLVRGLDYYTRTAFEVVSEHLGAQDALGGGGRYDGLVEELGGDATPGVGFGSGIERYLLAMKNQGVNFPDEKRVDVFIATMGSEARLKGMELCVQLRQKGCICEQELLDRSLKAQMREAGRTNARYVALLGEDEVKKGVVTLKDMDRHEQKEVPMGELVEKILGTAKS
jgi:histidyl-tRNA synthetase